jgi:hypothetical protein
VGDPNILQLQDQTRIRLIDPNQAEWKQHRVSFKNDPDKIPMFVVCSEDNNCPLCIKNSGPDGKQRFNISKRFAQNVWDYTTESVKILIGGPQIFNEFEDAKKIDLDPLASDWIIMKTGKGINTTYKLRRADAAPFDGPEIASLMDQAHDLTKFYKVPSVEKVFEILELTGWDYDSLKGTEFTLDESMAYVLPFGKCKGMTVEQAFIAEPDYLEWINNTWESDGKTGDPIYVAVHNVLVANNVIGGVMPDSPRAATEAPIEEVQESSAMVTMIGPDGNISEIPESASAALEEAGFVRADTPTEPEQVAGKPLAEILAVEPIPDGEIVHVGINGTNVPMKFSAALAAHNAGTDMDFVDPKVRAYVQSLSATQEPEPAEEEKPFACDQCDKSYKTKGGLTQHVNREHVRQDGQDDDFTDAKGPDSNGASDLEDRDVVLDRVKVLVGKYTTQDFGNLLDMFQEIAGTRDISEFSKEQLLTLEARLQEN